MLGVLRAGFVKDRSTATSELSAYAYWHGCTIHLSCTRVVMFVRSCMLRGGCFLLPRGAIARGWDRSAAHHLSTLAPKRPAGRQLPLFTLQPAAAASSPEAPAAADGAQCSFRSLGVDERLLVRRRASTRLAAGRRWLHDRRHPACTARAPRPPAPLRPPAPRAGPAGGAAHHGAHRRAARGHPRGAHRR